jgi:YebC/PmpR family DNA-binding regulatory protein
MSGHSHAKTIAHQKAATDQKRGQIFSKTARLIAVAVKEGGTNSETNSTLKAALERAKLVNMPNDNIDRAIKQAVGGQEGKTLTEFSFEAYGPGGIALLIDGITDNKNRTLGEIKQILSQHNGKLVQEGAVRWMFERKGVIVINPENQDKEKLELTAIEAGAQDMTWQENLLEIYVPTENLQTAKETLVNQGLKVESATLDWVAKEEIPLSIPDRTQAENLFLALDENDDVQDVYSNLKD